ncbi:hypothetical protein V6N13_077304 [Hibiscus sabdariffa]
MITRSVGEDDRKLIGVQANEEVVEVSSWVDCLPKEAQPYAKLARVDKPIGTWLFMFPLAWSAALAASAGSLPDFKTLAVVFCATPLLRGAACTINDFFDRDLDKMPQAYLGLTINWGAILGWHAVKGSLQPSILFPLFLSGFFWTILYDTIYAHQDKEDDLKVGIKSTALKFGESTKEWITGFATACIGSFALTGYIAALGWPFYAFLAAASAQLAWQIGTANLSSPTDCNQK